MKRAAVPSILVVVVLLALGVIAEAQQPMKVPRIGVLRADSPPQLSRQRRFSRQCAILVTSRARILSSSTRSAEGKVDRFPNLAEELVRLNVDVIWSLGPAVAPAKNATKTIPIVITHDCDPVGSGLVASLARPGGNITGLSGLAPELGGKRLELLKEVIPQALPCGCLRESNPPSQRTSLREIERAAGELGVKLQYLEVQSPKEIEPALLAASKGRAQAVLINRTPVTAIHYARIAELAIKNRLPTMYPDREFVEAGGLMSYGPDYNFMYRRVAVYVDKILKGTKPADLPVEQPTKFELVINLKTAKQISLTIPPNVLARADRVIK